MAPQRYITVAALTRYLKKKLDTDPHIQDLWLKGEISNFKRHSRGHMYLTLKDQASRVQAVMFASDNRHLGFQPEDGMKVLVRGDISLYEPYGQYQLYIKEMQPDGIGRLYQAFELLKKKLEAEGLFQPEHKKALPPYPERIAVITSPTGAAVRDIFTTIKRRYPRAVISVYPVLVQGRAASASVADAINKANEHGQADVIIVGRGGGSIEELWAFNEEVVARTIFASSIPVISAVGHETDFTIADFVADVRAATPTAAAELAVPAVMELSQRVRQMDHRLQLALKRLLKQRHERLNQLKNAYAFKYPIQLIRQKEQDLDRLNAALGKAAEVNIRQKSEKLRGMDDRLARLHPAERVSGQRNQVSQLEKRLERIMMARLSQKQAAFKALTGKMQALSPLNTLARGYAVAYDEDGRVLKTASQVKTDDRIDLRLSTGTLACRVEETRGGNTGE